MYTFSDSLNPCPWEATFGDGGIQNQTTHAFQHAV